MGKELLQAYLAMGLLVLTWWRGRGPPWWDSLGSHLVGLILKRGLLIFLRIVEYTDCVCLHNEPSVSAFDFDPSYLNVLHRGWKAAPTGELTRWAGSVSF